MFMKRIDIILDYINTVRSHPNAQEVFDALRQTCDISLPTVYRNLEKLVSMRKIRRISIPNQPERYDNLYSPHDHLVCTQCGCVVDTPLVSCYLPPSAAYDVHACDITLYGHCERCRRHDDSSDRDPHFVQSKNLIP